MNREFKRRMDREQRQQEKGAARQRAPVPTPQQGRKRERTRVRQYFRDIQGELRRVVWPTSNEVLTYSVVVIFVVAVLTGVVFVMDLGFAQGVVELFRPASG